MTSILDPAHPDLYTYHTMNNIVGSTSIDETGNFDATIYGATQVAGVMGSAMSFDGSDDYMVLDLTSLGTISEIAIACYVYRYQDNENGALFLCGSTGADRLVCHYPWGGNNTLYFDFNNATEGRVNTPWNSGWYNNWMPLVLQYDGTYLEIWLGGELIASKEQSGLTLTFTQPFYICRYLDNPVYQRSILSKLRIFNRGLTPAEITMLAEEPWPYEISGLVTVDGAPLSTQVRLYNAATGALLHTLSTDANGQYLKALNAADPVYAMAIEPSGYRPLVHGPINPALRSV